MAKSRATALNFSIRDWLENLTKDENMDNFGTNNDSSSKVTERYMLKNGWKHYSDQLNIVQVIQKAQKDPFEATRKAGEFLYEFTSGIFGYQGNRKTLPFTPLLYMFTSSFAEEWNSFVEHFVDTSFYDDVRDAPLFKGYYDSVLKSAIASRIFDNLGKPDKIIVCSGNALENYMYFPVENYTGLDNLVIPASIDVDFVYGKHTIVRVKSAKDPDSSRYNDSDETHSPFSYVVKSRKLDLLLKDACKGLAALGLGDSQMVGEMQPAYEINSFPQDLQDLVAKIEEKEAVQSKLNILVHGAPGTMKTSLCLSYAFKYLVPKGYFVFVLNADDVASFYPPSSMDKICLIINEVDRMALNRQVHIGQGRTERILSLFDGTLYTAIKPLGQKVRNTKIVTLMTANVIDSLDPAFLRKGRIDILHKAVEIHPDVLPDNEELEIQPEDDFELDEDGVPYVEDDEEEDDYSAKKRIFREYDYALLNSEDD